MPRRCPRRRCTTDPRAVIDKDFPVLALALGDPAGRDAAAFAAGLADSGHAVAVASAASVAGIHLPLPAPLHPLLDPIVAVQAFYPLAAALAAGAWPRPGPATRPAQGHDHDLTSTTSRFD